MVHRATVGQIGSRSDSPGEFENRGNINQSNYQQTNTILSYFRNNSILAFDVSHNMKQDRFITRARENDIDAMGWAELNINWRLKNYASASVLDPGIN